MFGFETFFFVVLSLFSILRWSLNGEALFQVNILKDILMIMFTLFIMAIVILWFLDESGILAEWTGHSFSEYDDYKSKENDSDYYSYRYRKDNEYHHRYANNDSLTDDRGYARDGKVEELETQLEKAKRLGRLTDDRGFIIDENDVNNRRDHYDPNDYDENGEYTGNYWGK